MASPARRNDPRWVLVRTRKTPDGPEQWLLIKHRDHWSGDLDVTKLAPQSVKSFGDLHVVVCCAGILRERMIFNMTEEEWDAVVAVHLKGHFTLMQPATRHMREKRSGSIVTFTSTAGLEGSPGQPNYSAAKEGIVGLTRSTALAMAKYGVRCNCIVAPSGFPFEKILAAARKEKCDLIFMASHGRRGLSSVLLGSETAKVLTHSKIPVLVVR